MSLGKRRPNEKQEPIWIEAARLATQDDTLRREMRIRPLLIVAREELWDVDTILLPSSPLRILRE
jgi:hypothetical protein